MGGIDRVPGNGRGGSYSGPDASRVPSYLGRGVQDNLADRLAPPVLPVLRQDGRTRQPQYGILDFDERRFVKGIELSGVTLDQLLGVGDIVERAIENPVYVAWEASIVKDVADRGTLGSSEDSLRGTAIVRYSEGVAPALAKLFSNLAYHVAPLDSVVTGKPANPTNAETNLLESLRETGKEPYQLSATYGELLRYFRQNKWLEDMYVQAVVRAAREQRGQRHQKIHKL